MTPYYRSVEGAVSVYHARYEDVLAGGLVPAEVALIHDDPPYGVRERTARASAGRGHRESASRALHGVGPGGLPCLDFPPIVGDHAPFNSKLLLDMDRPLVIWGGHLCEPSLPRSPSWLFWDKRATTTPDDNGDGELAWSNLGGPLRRFVHLWRGTCRASETGAVHLHPTQKPVALSAWVYQRAGLKRGDLVFVPHLGSGPDLPAARAAGLRIIGCDVEEWCCASAVARLPEAPEIILRRAAAFQRSMRDPPLRQAGPIGPLFGGSAGCELVRGSEG